MKSLLIITSLFVTLSVAEAFAQGPNTNAAQNLRVQNQIQNINNDEETVNFDNNIIRVNLENQPPVQQGRGSLENNVVSGNSKPCTDCDKVKQAIKLSHVSSGERHKKSFSMKKWSRKMEGRMNLKMKKIFSHKTKIRTNFGICFNWG